MEFYFEGKARGKGNMTVKGCQYGMHSFPLFFRKYYIQPEKTAVDGYTCVTKMVMTMTVS